MFARNSSWLGAARAHGANGTGARINRGLASFRRRYRSTTPRTYSGARHLALIVVVCLGVIAACVHASSEVGRFEWLAVPLTFLAANLVEYHAHRGPMHHPVRWLGLVYRRHVHEHHRFFRGQAMAVDAPADPRAVLFPLALIGFFFGLIALPLGVAVMALTTVNTALLYVATVTFYYLSYECLHFITHLPAASRLRRIRPLGALCEYHRRHHDPRWMSQCNFNISYPICDLLYGTARFADSDPVRTPPRAALRRRR